MSADAVQSNSSASSSSVTMDPSTPALLDSLRKASIKSPSNPKPLIRSTDHQVTVTNAGKDSKGKGKASNASETFKVTSWKTAEFAYRKASSVGIGKDLPTLARGLFSVQDGNNAERILVRGYDKFFNVGEMGWTKVSGAPIAIQ